MVKGFCQTRHQLVVMADVDVVVEADKGVFLLAHGLDGLLPLDHQRKHLGVAVGVVGMEISFAYLPCTE